MISIANVYVVILIYNLILSILTIDKDVLYNVYILATIFLTHFMSTNSIFAFEHTRITHTFHSLVPNSLNRRFYPICFEESQQLHINFHLLKD